MLAAPMARAGSAIGGCAAAINAPMRAEAVGGAEAARWACWSDPGTDQAAGAGGQGAGGAAAV